MVRLKRREHICFYYLYKYMQEKGTSFSTSHILLDHINHTKTNKIKSNNYLLLFFCASSFLFFRGRRMEFVFFSFFLLAFLRFFPCLSCMCRISVYCYIEFVWLIRGLSWIMFSNLGFLLVCLITHIVCYYIFVCAVISYEDGILRVAEKIPTNY